MRKRLNRLQSYWKLFTSILKVIIGKALKNRRMELRGSLGFLANRYNSTPSLQEELRGTQGWINATIGLKSEDNLVEQAIVIKDGEIKIENIIPADANAVVIFVTEEDVIKQLNASPEEAYKMILRGRIRVEGNMIYLGFWDYLSNRVIGKDQYKAIKAQIEKHQKLNQELASGCDTDGREERKRRQVQLLKGEKVNAGVKFLSDPYLSQYTLNDFPRLSKMRDERLNAKPEVTAEYGKLITDFFVEHGYEEKKNGEAWEPNLRTAESFKYVMENRQPIIRQGDLLAGSYTPNPILGAVGQPNSYGVFLWGELHSCDKRELEPFSITAETIQTLHKHVFPFWAERNITRWWNIAFDTPLPARIHDRFFSIFFWKSTFNMENSPGFERVIKGGLKGLLEDIDDELRRDTAADKEKRDTLAAMKIGIEGTLAYTRNLCKAAKNAAAVETNQQRRAEWEWRPSTTAPR